MCKRATIVPFNRAVLARSLSIAVIGMLLASCSPRPSDVVVKPTYTPVNIPSHLSTNVDPPATQAADMKSKADLLGALGDWVAYGRMMFTRYGELIVSIKTANDNNATIAAPAGKP